MIENLYQREKKENPSRFMGEKLEIRRDENGLLESHPCYGCVVFKSRTPVHCDPCNVNPDRDRLKRIGML